ncbi:hypothetical protein Drose_34960 [Dactylosporangium roseum]|uniref:Thioesterase domain-containing protein n=1 Tax=Dactylosporangium roseum TaxID=47989 RepID=A0ABY5Z2F4_9ACTN|nr:thioesterase domain-containing protein [Dactylosporangium roseum]UWZ36200.1 hypothetical protein Drose_34960 [Dactylosporangium roseum]
MLYSLPPVAAGPRTHAWLPRHAPSWLRVFTLRPAGRENRYTEPAPRRMEDLVADLGPRLAAHAAAHGRPFLLLGDCGGAFGAYEIGRFLEAKGTAPRMLAVLKQVAPQARTARRPLHDLPTDDLWSRLRSTNLVSAELTADRRVFALFEKVLRADLELVETYRWLGVPVGFPVCVLPPAGVAADPATVVEQWEKATTGAVSRLPAPDEPGAISAELARLATAWLEPTVRGGEVPEPTRHGRF